METYTASLTDKQPIPFTLFEVSNRKPAAPARFKDLAKGLTRILSLRNSAIAVETLSAVIAWFSAVIYDTTESRASLIALAVSSLVGVLSLVVIVFQHLNVDEAE